MANAPSYSRGAIERIARKLRSPFATEFNGSVADPLALLQSVDDLKLDVGGVRVPAQYAVETHGDNLGYSYFDANRGVLMVTVSPSTYAGVCSGRADDVFTAMHEIGHGILHREVLIRDALRPPGLARAGSPDPRVERQADEFALAVLMPANALAAIQGEFGELDTHVLVQQFRVTRDMAAARVSHFRSSRSELLSVYVMHRAGQASVTRGVPP